MRRGYAQSDGSMTPDYSRITQTGVDLQYLMGETALKSEFIHRSGQYDSTGAAKAIGPVSSGSSAPSMISMAMAVIWFFWRTCA